MTTSTANAIDPLKQGMLPRLRAIADRGEKVIIGLIDGPVDAHLPGLSTAKNRAATEVCKMQSHWISRTVAAVTAIGLTLLLATGADAERAQDAGPEPTVVLVHGGFTDASAWDAVIEELQDDGFPVIAPANPLRGTLADSAYLASVLDTLSGPLILVGASEGGIVISNAAAMTQNAQNVRALVFVAAFIPDVGERGQELTPLPGSLIGPALQFRSCPVASCPDGLELYVDPAHFREVMAGDLSPDTTNVLAAAQRPVSPAAATEVSEFAAWHTVPSFALVATEDNAIGVANERVMAQRAARKHTVEVRASHFVMISRPGAVVRLIESAAAHR